MQPSDLILIAAYRLEVIEEDIIFPCPDTPSSRTPKQSPTLRPRFSRSVSRSTGGIFQFETSYDTNDDDEGLEDLDLNPDPDRDRTSDRGSKGRSLDTVSERRIDSRDHTKLKEAFSQLQCKHSLTSIS